MHWRLLLNKLPERAKASPEDAHRCMSARRQAESGSRCGFFRDVLGPCTLFCCTNPLDVMRHVAAIRCTSRLISLSQQADHHARRRSNLVPRSPRSGRALLWTRSTRRWRRWHGVPRPRRKRREFSTRLSQCSQSRAWSSTTGERTRTMRSHARFRSPPPSSSAPTPTTLLQRSQRSSPVRSPSLSLRLPLHRRSQTAAEAL